LTPTVNFDPTTHRYTDAENIERPSVTTVLAFAKIVDFSVVREEIRERSLKRGTSVHWITELSDLGALKPRSAPKALRGYLKAWRSWRENSGFVPMLIEKPFISPFGYAGTPDRFGSFPNGTWAVIDLKSGADGEVPVWTGVQLSAYAKWYSVTEGKFGIRRIGVKLHPDGTYRAKEFPVNTMPLDFAKFYGHLQDWKKENGVGN
jgi:hypothetical protein